MKGEMLMLSSGRLLIIASVIVAGLAIAPSLFAQDTHEHGTTDSATMMGRDSTMGRGGMMGMMGMMGSMMQMMEHCNQMMGAMMDGSSRPNDQWRRSPRTPEN
jgi:hypothetical protein